MTKWFRGAEHDRDGHRRDDFDPIDEGARYRLTPAVSAAIWKRLRAEATDRPTGLFDEEHARRRFHIVAERVGKRRGRQIRPDPTKLTRAEGDQRRLTDPLWDVFADVHRSKGIRGGDPARSWDPDSDLEVEDGPYRLPGEREIERLLARPLAGESTGLAEDAPPRQLQPDPSGALAESAPHSQLQPDPPGALAEDVPHSQLQPDPPGAPVELQRAAPAWSTPARAWLPPALVKSWPDALAPVVERPAVTLLRREIAPVDSNAAHDPGLDQALGRRGAGAPLPEALRQEMEALLGADLRRVRLHTDEVAGTAAHAIRARAFTVGEDIFFAPGAFDPDSAAGRELLAHELTHVVQAQHGRVAQGESGHTRVSNPGDTIEQEAEQAARRVAAAPRTRPDDADPGAAGEAEAAEEAGDHARQRPVSNAAAVSVQSATTLLRAPDPTATAAPLKVPPGGTPIHQIGIVAWDGHPPLRLRSSASTTEDNVVASLPFNTHVQVIQRFPGDWLLVATLDGKMGFCARPYVWSAPEHKLPEPSAKLHKVDGGDKGAAIHVARHYYGDVADKWGTDLRFYVTVLGAVNHLTIPDSTDGWKTVQFRENDLIWIPSAAFARSLHGALNSGSRTYQLASGLGVAGALERVGELIADVQEAIRRSGKHIPAAVARHVEQSVVSVLESLLWMAVGAVGLLAISTALGAAIGALAGGAGAAPGAAAGFEVGMALLEWIGLGFLVAWIGNAVVRIGTAFGAFFGAVWNAHGNLEALDRAALAFAEALGTLAGVLIEALAMWAISVGVKAAAGKLQGTAIGRQIGASRLGEWLEQRIQNHQAGRSPLPGPREALRRLLENRRRGERDDEQGPTPPEPADAWSELARRHGLDDVVTRILREDRVDPAVADRLLAKGMNQFDLGELALDHGADGVRAADTLVQANVQPSVARRALRMARDMGIGRRVIDLINSKHLENLQGFRKFLADVAIELRLGKLGKYNQLMEAHERAMRGNRVSLEGRRQAPDDAESGQADVIDYTQRQAVQMKTVTSETEDGVIDNLQKAINQLSGVKGEHPPSGFQRIADIRIDNAANPLRFASREQLLSALRGKLLDLDELTPASATPGLVRITNAISTFLFAPAELQ